MGLFDFWKQFHKKPEREKRRIVGKIATYCNYAWAGIKVLFGLFSLSFFYCISAIFTVCLGLSKHMVADGIAKCNHKISKEREYFAKIILILFAATAVFLAYMLLLFFIPFNMEYSPVVAGLTVCLSVAEFVSAVIGIKKSYRERDLLLSAMTGIHLTGAFSAVVLAQVSILSLAGAANATLYNAIGGIIFGVLGSLVCAAMIVIYQKAGKYEKRLVITDPHWESLNGRGKNFSRKN